MSLKTYYVSYTLTANSAVEVQAETPEQAEEIAQKLTWKAIDEADELLSNLDEEASISFFEDAIDSDSARVELENESVEV